MHERQAGTLKRGCSDEPVKSKKQAIAIGLSVFARSLFDQSVHRQERRRIGVRRSRLADDRVRLGLLLGADLLARR